MELFKVKYKEEAMELIESMEKSLLLMDGNSNKPAIIEEVFRNMHTLKGNSSMFGYKLIADFTHHLESIYTKVLTGEITISKQILNVTFSALDHLSFLVNKEGPLSEAEKAAHAQLSDQVIEIIGINSTPNYGLAADVVTACGDVAEELKAYHISFIPAKNYFANGSNPLSIINELMQLGQCKVIAHVDKIPALEDCEVDSCYTSWDIYLSTNAALKPVEDVFLFVKDRCKLEIRELVQNNVLSDTFIEPGGLAHHQNKPGAPKVLKIFRPSVEEKTAPVYKKQVISSIRVPSERLDNLMSLVSELMTLQAKLGILTEQNPQAELLAVTENLEKISTSLRDNAFSMCLVPLENMITPFHRLVRDLAAELNKEIEFVTEGTETELDKNIMEGLSDPLMHLVRNSIDHGIEYPEVRLKAGKPRHGKISFKAFCAGTNVYIEIHDDGKGIDPEKIRNKAIQKGIIGTDDILNDKEILNLIFLPGFSTAEKVSEISGRGVGMDVVKRRIADIRGQIKINSQINNGTTITIKLPITVSVIDGLLVKINDADFVIPLSVVERCYEVPSAGQLNKFNNLIVLDGEQIPFISLPEEFDGSENLTASQEIVIVYYDEKKVGLLVDRIVGKFQAVLKPLGRYFQHMDTISGATILGDGKIALVLDTNYVTEQFLNKKSVLKCQ
ncbi:MAG: chemotaxis protein CheA [Ginsengibacter sp.]